MQLWMLCFGMRGVHTYKERGYGRFEGYRNRFRQVHLGRLSSANCQSPERPDGLVCTRSMVSISIECQLYGLLYLHTLYCLPATACDFFALLVACALHLFAYRLNRRVVIGSYQ